MKPLERMGAREQSVVRVRLAGAAASGARRHFDGRLEPTLRALLDLLLPGVRDAVDLVAFVDRYADEPLGRGDRRDGVPAAPDLFTEGLSALVDIGFPEMSETEQRDVIMAMRRREDQSHAGLVAGEFIDRLLDKALAGYLSHPATWERIGFNGPAYPDGYAWIGSDEALARRARRRGWDQL